MRVARRIITAGFIIIIGGLFYYQFIKGNYFLKKSQANYIRVVQRLATRGTIFDRNHNILAVDEPIFNIAVVPYQIGKRRKAVFAQLQRFLNLPRGSIAVNYKRNIQNLFSPVDIAINIDKKLALAVKEKFGDAVMLKVTPRRLYPYKREITHILGYVKRAGAFYEALKPYGYAPDERVGFMGVEQYYNSYLQGKSGGKLLEVNSTGDVVGFLGESRPQRGKNISLTINIRMQLAAYRALGRHRGVIIMMNPHNGEILAFCSRPSYNLNDMIQGKRMRRVFRDKEKPLINRGIQSVYPLGSVFKPVVAIAGLEEKVITAQTIFNCPGYLMVGNHKFSCWSIHGRQNLFQAIAHSCNVYFYNLGLRLGIDKIAKWARKFGLGKKTGIDLPYEKKGVVPDPAWKQKVTKHPWFKGDTVNTSIGQGYLTATPLQALAVISVFANGGYIVEPHLLGGVGGKPSLSVNKNYLNISKSYLKTVKQALRDVVVFPDGTAHILNSLNLGIAGKTGTAQNAGLPHGWFVGFFPYHNPKYAFCVFLENGLSSHEALKAAYKFLGELKDEGLI